MKLILLILDDSSGTQVLVQATKELHSQTLPTHLDSWSIKQGNFF